MVRYQLAAYAVHIVTPVTVDALTQASAVLASDVPMPTQQKSSAFTRCLRSQNLILHTMHHDVQSGPRMAGAQKVRCTVTAVDTATALRRSCWVLRPGIAVACALHNEAVEKSSIHLQELHEF